MSKRFFEAGESEPARELSKEEKFKTIIRARFTEYAKKDWVQKLLKATDTPLDQWIDKQVANEIEKKKMQKSIKQNEVN